MSDFLLGLQETPFSIWVCLGIFIVVLITSIIVKSKNHKQVSSKLTTKTLAFGGMCVALSFILSYIKLFEMPPLADEQFQLQSFRYQHLYGLLPY